MANQDCRRGGLQETGIQWSNTTLATVQNFGQSDIYDAIYDLLVHLFGHVSIFLYCKHNTYTNMNVFLENCADVAS